MADRIIQSGTLTDIANAIRSKDGTTGTIDPANFAARINGLGGTWDSRLLTGLSKTDTTLTFKIYGAETNPPKGKVVSLFVGANIIAAFPELGEALFSSAMFYCQNKPTSDLGDLTQQFSYYSPVGYVCIVSGMGSSGLSISSDYSTITLTVPNTLVISSSTEASLYSGNIMFFE